MEDVTQSQVSVQLLDHGHTSVMVNLEQLGHLQDTELREEEPFSFRVCVEGLEPAGSMEDKWTEEATVCFGRLLRGRRVMMQRTGGRMVELWVEDTKGVNPVGPEEEEWSSVAEHLLLRGVALPAGTKARIMAMFPNPRDPTVDAQGVVDSSPNVHNMSKEIKLEKVNPA